MTHEQQFDRRLADWLDDGPLDAPDRAVMAAVAHARAHPRRHNPLAGLWRTVMTSMQPTPFPSPARRTRITAFATFGVVAVVALAVVGGGALLLNRAPADQPAAAPAGTASPAPTPAPAAGTDEALVADQAALMSSRYDAARVAAFYAPNAVVHDLVEGLTQTGLDEIGARIRYLNAQDFKVVVTSAPIRQDDFVANFVKFGGGEAAFPGLVVYELEDGKVLNQWVYDAASSPAASSPAASSPSAASDEALVADLAAVASSPYDAARVAALYAPDAVMRELGDANVTSKGLGQIGSRIRYFNTQDFEAVVTSAPIRQDNFVAVFSKYGTGGDLSGRALVVYELKDGKVQNQWVYPAE